MKPINPTIFFLISRFLFKYLIPSLIQNQLFFDSSLKNTNDPPDKRNNVCFVFFKLTASLSSSLSLVFRGLMDRTRALFLCLRLGSSLRFQVDFTLEPMTRTLTHANLALLRRSRMSQGSKLSRSEERKLCDGIRNLI